MVRGLTLIYGFKRVVRSWKLFVALLLGVVLASTFFAGINIGADTAAKHALDQRLSQILVDMLMEPATAISYVDQLRARLADIDTEIEKLDKDFKAGKISGDEYVEQRLKQTKDGLRDELHRMGVVT